MFKFDKNSKVGNYVSEEFVGTGHCVFVLGRL